MTITSADDHTLVSLSQLVKKQLVGILEELLSAVRLFFSHDLTYLSLAAVIVCATLLHGLTPRLGVYVMNVSG